MLKPLLLGAGLALALAAPAAAASFDCAKAAAKDEIAVCKSCNLSQSDVKMATLYEVLTNLVGMGVRGDLQDSQRAFLKTRAACGADEGCIAKAYETRIGELQQGLKTVYAGGPY
ncbi:MAG: hypothetical protein Kilf2KO_18800 [Rhodospirillales bacterium]